jgi:hypothetical protein
MAMHIPDPWQAYTVVIALMTSGSSLVKELTILVDQWKSQSMFYF